MPNLKSFNYNLNFAIVNFILSYYKNYFSKKNIIKYL